MEKITKVIDPSYRSGTTKKGDAYVIMQIETSSGKEATIFAPAAVGDEVALEHNTQYNNYSAKKVTPAMAANIAFQTEVMSKLDAILAAVGGKTVVEKVKDIIPGAEEVPDNLDDVPFK